MGLTVYIIHGANANPNANWFPWLKKELKSLNINVIVPAFPIREQQTLDKWLSTFSKFIDDLDENSIMIGHSLGPAFIFNVLERIKTEIRACFLVAPFANDLGITKYDSINHTFYEVGFDWNTIRNRSKRFYVYASDNDPHVPMGISKSIATKLDAKFELIHDGGHLNAESGYVKFTLLLEDLKKEIS